jgi:hypothetical protein
MGHRINDFLLCIVQGKRIEIFLIPLGNNININPSYDNVLSMSAGYVIIQASNTAFISGLTLIWKSIKRGLQRRALFVCPYWLFCTLAETETITSISHIPNSYQNVRKEVMEKVNSASWD